MCSFLDVNSNAEAGCIQGQGAEKYVWMDLRAKMKQREEETAKWIA
jgi:hypothetical protein